MTRPPRGIEAAELLYRAGNYYAAFSKYLSLAEQGVALAQVQVSWFYANAIGVRQDLSMAMTWAERASESGSAVGKYYLGRLCITEGEYGRAMKCFQDSAENGFIPSLLRIGRCHEFGLGVAKQRSEALRAYEEAMNAGNIRAKAEFARRLIRGWRGVAGVPLGLKLMTEAAIQAIRIACKDPDDHRLIW